MPIVSKAKEKGKRGNDVVAVAGIDGCLQSASNTFVRQVAAKIDRISIKEVCAGMFHFADAKTRALPRFDVEIFSLVWLLSRAFTNQACLCTPCRSRHK